MFYTHTLDPIAFTLFGLAFPWYWLAYVFGFFFIYLMALSLIKRKISPLSEPLLNSYSLGCWISIIVGGRLGYILIYYPSYYLKNPSEIYQIWKGGMSFHGALILCTLSILYLSYKHRQSPYYMGDLLALLAPVALAAGRLANFMGGELVGTPTSLPWGVIFPFYDDLPRHPSQLYQASLEGLGLFWLLWRKKHLLQKSPGKITAWFFIGYGLLRSLVELFRQPDLHIGYLYGVITTGHVLCFIMIFLGTLLLTLQKKHRSLIQEPVPSTKEQP